MLDKTIIDRIGEIISDPMAGMTLILNGQADEPGDLPPDKETGEVGHGVNVTVWGGKKFFFMNRDDSKAFGRGGKCTLAVDMAIGKKGLYAKGLELVAFEGKLVKKRIAR